LAKCSARYFPFVKFIVGCFRLLVSVSVKVFCFVFAVGWWVNVYKLQVVIDWIEMEWSMILTDLTLVRPRAAGETIKKIFIKYAKISS
jgi:hypothetical protein